MDGRPPGKVRPTWRSATYVTVVAATATVGFVEGSPWPILLAVLLTLPVSIVTVPCYYIVYGLLAQVPGANPSINTRVETQAGHGGPVSSVTTGMRATWFVITTETLGVAALTLAALVNVLALQLLLSRRRARRLGETAAPLNPR